MHRIIIDTNLFLAGLFFDKNPEDLLLLGIDGQIQIILPIEIVTEVNEKISHKFNSHEKLGDAKLFWEVLHKAFLEKPEDIQTDKKSEVVPFVCRDPKDQIILDACIKFNPDYFITGDKDILEIKNPPFPVVKLLTFYQKEFPELIKNTNLRPQK